VKTPVAVGVRRVVATGSYAVVELDGEVDVGPPGTFAMVRDPAGAAFLPRAVGLFRRPDGTPAFLIDPAYGVGALARAATLEVLTPLGRGFDLDGATAAATLAVGGGIGTTVFFGLPAALGGPVRVAAGFREASQAAMLDLIEPSARRDVALAPQVVTDLVDLGGVERVLASGPGPMVRAVAALAAAAGVPCQVALEAPMACGFGACYGCAVQLDGTWKRLCIEGPVVAAERLG
jgi:dihydroorotate dehydrogenase electron transfer subunit